MVLLGGHDATDGKRPHGDHSDDDTALHPRFAVYSRNFIHESACSLLSRVGNPSELTNTQAGNHAISVPHA
jgi:hypothetical protein